MSRRHDETQRSHTAAAWSEGCLPRGQHAGRRAWQRQSGDRGGRKLILCNARAPRVRVTRRHPGRTFGAPVRCCGLIAHQRARGGVQGLAGALRRRQASDSRALRVWKHALQACCSICPPKLRASLRLGHIFLPLAGCRLCKPGAVRLKPAGAFLFAIIQQCCGRWQSSRASLNASFSHSVYAASMGPSVTVGSPRRSGCRSGCLRSLALLLVTLSACLLHTLAVEQAHAAGSSGAGTNPRPTLLAARASATRRRLHTCGSGCLYPKIAVGAFASAPLCVRFLFSLPYLAFATSQPPFAYGICEAVGCNCAPPCLAFALLAALCSSELL